MSVRHPICGYSQGTQVKDGTLALHPSPARGPHGLNASPQRRIQVRTLVFDGEKLHRLFHSAAYSMALARNIKVKAMESAPNDPIGVKFFTAVLPSRYLSKEIDLPQEAELEKQADKDANEFGNLFWQELDERGVEGAVTFLRDVEAQRENALARVRETYRQASDFNQRADASQENLRHTLVTVKCASTIIVAGLTLPFVPAAAVGIGWASAGSIGGLAGFGVGTGYSIGLELVKNWDRAESAQLVLVARDKAATKVDQKVAKQGAKFLQKTYEGESQGIKNAEETLAGGHWLEKRIAAATDTAVKAKLLRRLGRAKIGAQAVKNAGRLATALKGVPYLFFLWSATNALHDAHSEW
jgi:hypothetical protein